jgi:hypothetical protein
MFDLALSVYVITLVEAQPTNYQNHLRLFTFCFLTPDKVSVTSNISYNPKVCWVHDILA